MSADDTNQGNAKNPLTPESFALVRRIFEQASGLAPERRTLFIEQACAGMPEVRVLVEELLRAADRVGERFDPDRTEITKELRSSAAEQHPEFIGPYRIGAVIGRGGMGVVYEAEQKNPHRSVALKIIKAGMDTAQIIARFEQERQALAILDHPNIARVLDAGATESGRPYFVMELVRGVPISAYCDAHRLPIEERLELFEQVCLAVQHAHTKGIIHRDIKPSNVLVGLQDGKPVVKVIDFGVAKATMSKLTEKTLFTEHRQLIGTPEYMSPEQAEGSPDIDTRTDVYSLGVLLYELLTGSTPFDSRGLRSAAFGEIQRIILETDPPRPSARLLQTPETAAGIAAQRRTEPRKLTATIRGELDWIVMKALEKERRRRYESASGLAADIRRHLNGEAVIAAPPSGIYQARKFVRRHKGAVVSVIAIGVTLAAGIVAFAWQARVAGEQRDLAILARTESDKRASELKSVSEFQSNMLAQVDPTSAGKELSSDVIAQVREAIAQSGTGTRAGEMAAFESLWKNVNATDTARRLIDTTILRPAIQAIDARFKDQPIVAASLKQALADRYGDLGMLDAALPLQREAIEIRRRSLGSDHKDTLSSLNNLVVILQDQGKLEESEVVAREVLERKRRVLGDDHDDTIAAIGNMGTTLYLEGKLDGAEPFYTECLERAKRALGPKHPRTIGAISSLAVLRRAQGRVDEAIAMQREALKLSREVLGEDSPKTLAALADLAAMLQGAGKLEEAEPLAREALEKMRRLLGEEHPRTLVAISELDILLQTQGKDAEAEPLSREALAKQRKVLGDENVDTLISYSSLAGLLNRQRKFEEAATMLGPVEPAARRLFVGSMSARLGQFLIQLGRARAGIGDNADGEKKLLEAHAILVKAIGPFKKSTKNCERALAELYTAWAVSDSSSGYDAKAKEWKERAEGAPPEK